MTTHVFGGDWTRDKLDRVHKYLYAYTTIFAKNPKAQYYTTIYVDAFAGTGYLHPESRDANLDLNFAELSESDNQNFLKGSARTALEVEPSFDQYLFIEQDHEYAKELDNLRNQFPSISHKISIIEAEANDFLKKWCGRMNWDKNRAVVFLDPYGMQVEWSLIKSLAETKAIDLWLLFPFGVAVNRILKKDAPPEGSWANALTRLFGSDEWKTIFYRTNPQSSLFGNEEEQIKDANFTKISEYFVTRLETVFPYVADRPLPLYNSKNNPLYLLCFAAGNPVGGKTALKIANHILKR
jgi:three-Cys-motif partner protein